MVLLALPRLNNNLSFGRIYLNLWVSQRHKIATKIQFKFVNVNGLSSYFDNKQSYSGYQ